MSKGKSMTIIIIIIYRHKNNRTVFFLVKRIDLYLSDYKLPIEIDEKGDIDKQKENKEERKSKIEYNLVVNVLELILIVKNLMLILKLVKYAVKLTN